MTDHERENILPLLLQGFGYVIGKENAITQKVICKKLEQNCGVKLSGIRFRAMVHHIRVNNLLAPYYLVSSGCGYWCTDSDAEINSFLDNIRGRRQSLEEIENSVIDLK